MREPRKIPFTIPVGVGGVAGSTIFRFAGRMVTCSASTAAFTLSRDGGRPVDIGPGRVIGDDASPEFEVVQLYNATGVAITGLIVISDEPVGPEQAVQASVTTNVSVSGQNKDTYSKGTAGAIPGPGVTFLGVDVGGQKRKAITIWNDEAAGSGNVIQVLGANGVVMHKIPPQQGHVREVGGSISLSGAGFAYNVGEDFYQL